MHARPNSLSRLLIDPALSPEKENVANNNKVIIATQIDDPISLRTATNLLLEFQDDYLVRLAIVAPGLVAWGISCHQAQTHAVQSKPKILTENSKFNVRNVILTFFAVFSRVRTVA